MFPLSRIAFRCRAHAGTFALLALAAALSSCTSSGPKIEGVPSNLPSIPLYGSARTPPHHMNRGDYPFDSNGNYVTSWAAEGRSAPGPGDSPAWSSSSRKSKSQPVKVSSPSKPKRVVEDSPPKKVVSSGSSTKKSTPAPARKPATTSSSTGGSVKHVVKGSDTLYGLAKKYGTTVQKIKAANGLSSDVLRDGRTLTIPK